MKSTVVAAILLLGLVTLASARNVLFPPAPPLHFHPHRPGVPPAISPHVHHEQHDGDIHANMPPPCTFVNSKGFTFDLSRLSEEDLTIKDEHTGSTFYFNPCRDVHATLCPSGAAVCEINKNEVTTHAVVAEAHWGDGSVDGAAIDITYGSGKVCIMGSEDCKMTTVEVRCSLSSNSESTPSKLVSVSREEYLLTFILDTPYACDMSALCTGFINEENCMDNHWCEWANERCMPTSDIHRHTISRQHVVILAVSALGGFGAVTLLCCSALCICAACRRAALRRKMRGLPTIKKSKKSKRSHKKGTMSVDEELSLVTPENSGYPQQAVYPHLQPQAFIMQQAADGSFIPVPVAMAINAVPHAYTAPMVMQATYHPQPQ